MAVSVVDRNGQELADSAVQWISLNPSVATVSDSGLLTAHALGTATIRATIDEVADEITVSVQQMPVAAVGSSFFPAFSWWGNPRTAPIITQAYDPSQCPGTSCLNNSSYRIQWNDIWDYGPVVEWVANPANRGHLYTLGDDVNDYGYEEIYRNDPAGYGRDYCRFVRNVQAVDPTSEFGTSMIHDNVQDWWLNAVADAMLNEHRAGRCGNNPISEWTFNVYGRFSPGLAAGFTDYVDKQSKWAVSLPAPIGKPVFLGAWVLAFSDNVPNNDPRYLQRLREAKAWLFANPNIRGARYLLYEPWPVERSDPHPLTDAQGNLNATGWVYAEVTGRIAGPRRVRPGATCKWTAETSGGPPPYTYEWSVNGTKSGSAVEFTFTNASAPFTLQMRVTDASLGYGVAKIDVVLDANAPAC